ncbi:MAG: hypothetical protein AVDCRST_MAG05-1491, partial [uncultured Rubrobacteraceae bacterium]
GVHGARLAVGDPARRGRKGGPDLGRRRSGRAGGRRGGQPRHGQEGRLRGPLSTRRARDSGGPAGRVPAGGGAQGPAARPGPPGLCRAERGAPVRAHRELGPHTRDPAHRPARRGPHRPWLRGDGDLYLGDAPRREARRRGGRRGRPRPAAGRGEDPRRRRRARHQRRGLRGRRGPCNGFRPARGHRAHADHAGGGRHRDRQGGHERGATHGPLRRRVLRQHLPHVRPRGEPGALQEDAPPAGTGRPARRQGVRAGLERGRGALRREHAGPDAPRRHLHGRRVRAVAPRRRLWRRRVRAPGGAELAPDLRPENRM